MIGLLLAPYRFARAAYRDVADLWRLAFAPDAGVGCRSNAEIDEMED